MSDRLVDLELTPIRRRRADWPEVLAREIDAARGRAFAWGSHDCCTWATRVVDALGGSRIARLFEGRYRTPRGAWREIARLAGNDAAAPSLLDAAAERIARALERPEIPVARASRGDCMLADVDVEVGGKLIRQPALGICVGAHAAFVGPKGLMFLPLARCRRAWRV